MTEQVHELLKRVVAALGSGKSISPVIRDEEITTQQAADLLGVSRPTLVGLIEAGEMSGADPHLMIVHADGVRDANGRARPTWPHQIHRKYLGVEQSAFR